MEPKFNYQLVENAVKLRIALDHKPGLRKDADLLKMLKAMTTAEFTRYKERIS